MYVINHTVVCFWFVEKNAIIGIIVLQSQNSIGNIYGIKKPNGYGGLLKCYH